MTDNLQVFTKAFSGIGIDESALISIVGKSHTEHTRSLRKGTPHLFIEDERAFERWDDHRIRLLKHEFVRFKNALVLWAMHPWERDARLVKEALKKGPKSYHWIVEIACTRSSEELLGARKAYHSLFDHSIEEDVASHVKGCERKLLVALVSAYRYEGPKVKDDAAKSEAKLLVSAIKSSPIENEEIVRILSTRSKPHLQAVFKHYKEISSKSIIEDLNGADLILKDAIKCLYVPHVYFSEVIDEAMRTDVDKSFKKGLTRVFVTRADADLKEIKDEYNNLYKVSLAKRVEETANGNYRDFLLALLSRVN